MDTATDPRIAGMNAFIKNLERDVRNLDNLAGIHWVRTNEGGLPKALEAARWDLQAAAAYARNMETWLAWARSTGQPLSELTDPPYLACPPRTSRPTPDPAIDSEADAIRRAIREIADADSGTAERQIPVVGGPHDGQMLEVIHTTRIFVTSPDWDRRLKHIHAGYERDDTAGVYRFIGYWQHHIYGPYTPAD